MNSTNVLGIVVLVLVLAGLFAGLWFAYSTVGKAVNYAEARQNVVPCSDQQPCENGVCVQGYCRVT